MNGCRLLLSCLLALGFALPAWSQETTPAAARLVDGKSFDATLKAIEPDRVLFTTGDKERALPLDDLFRWGKPADVRKGSYLLLADGGVVAGDVKSITADHVQIESTRRPGLWKTSRLPRGQVRAIVYQAAASPAERERFDAELLDAYGTHDRLVLTSGDSLTGSLLEASLPGDPAEGAMVVLRFLPAGAKDPLAIGQERIVAVALGGRAAARPSEAARYWLGLADGSLLLASAIAVKDDVVSITLAAGGMLEARVSDDDLEPPEPFWSRVTLVQPLSPRVTYLSDLKTIGFKHVPLLDWQQEYANDRSVTNSQLRAGGERFIKGIGMPATSRLAYEIPEAAKRFEAEIAIDDDAGRAGSTIFRVYLEGAAGAWKPAYESKIIRGGDAPQAVRVELREARRLALVVDMADRGDQRDWADWLSARFVK